MRKAKDTATKKGKYSPQAVEAICAMLRRDTYTIAEVCQAVGIKPSTYHAWINEKPEFAEAVEQAKEERLQVFVREAQKSLLKKIQGYEATETKVVTIPNKQDPSKPSIKEQVTIKKHVSPDTTALIFALTNLAPEQWKNKHTQEITGKDGRDLFGELTDEELNQEIKTLEKQLKKTKQEKDKKQRQ